MRSYGPVHWVDYYYDMHVIMCAQYYTSCCIQQNCQMHIIACSQAIKMLSSTLPSAIDDTLPACLIIYSEVSSQNALKDTPKSALKYTPNCTWWRTYRLLDCMLLSKLSRHSQAYSRALSQVRSTEARHSQSHLTICSHVCSWVLNPETCWVAGARHKEVGGSGQNHDVSWYHRLNLIISLGTATRSHDASRSWCWQLQPHILQER